MVDERDVKSTLNLPQTSFAMKAKLSQKEPELLRQWEDQGLYGKIQAAHQDDPSFVLHDGPPYANGNIHLGTAMNKILKDFIVKSQTMIGRRSPYVPGWDCHGLPIEIHVDKLLGEKKKGMSLIEIRGECRKYAEKFIEIQRSEFKRLGVFGEWDKPYLTMNPAYEAEVLRHLAAFFASGNVIKGKRAVHWCPVCKTALAEAEIIYKDKTSPSIYVRFPVASDLSGIAAALKGRVVSVIIWTTTPWTLPANLAIAFHPEHEYAAWESGGEVYITAHRLMPIVAEICGLKDPGVLAVFPGRALEGLKARHPFIERDSLFVLADYVSLEEGTGAVHTAPGHGHDDFLTGLAYGLDIYAPPRRRRPVHGRSPEVCRDQCLQGQPHHSRRHEKGRVSAAGGPDHALLSALLAVQEPRRLPGHGPMVYRHGPRRATEEGPRGHQKRALDPGLG